jgi:hypothetical protein
MYAHETDATPPLAAELAPETLDPEALARANINPRTGLATDYLNQFNEVIMLLELLPGSPEFADDILTWQPLNYHDYFMASHFKDRKLALLAYEAADPVARQSLEEIADDMNGFLLATLASLRRNPSPDEAGALGTSAASWLKPLVARAGAVINGQQSVPLEVADEAAAQAMVDALFDELDTP